MEPRVLSQGSSSLWYNNPVEGAARKATRQTHPSPIKKKCNVSFKFQPYSQAFFQNMFSLQIKLFASFLSKRGPPAFNDLPAADCGELGCGVGVTDGDREGPSLPKASHTQRVSLRFCSDRRAGMLHVFLPVGNWCILICNMYLYIYAYIYIRISIQYVYGMLYIYIRPKSRDSFSSCFSGLCLAFVCQYNEQKKSKCNNYRRWFYNDSEWITTIKFTNRNLSQWLLW